MNIQGDNFLKDWRDKAGISQKRFAELAGVSLTTIRQFEEGTHKPQSKTLKRLTELIQNIENGTISPNEIFASRKRGKPAKVDLTAVRRDASVKIGEISANEKTESAVTKTETKTIEAIPELQRSTPVAGYHPGIIQLSNLDLELINRILNMSGKEKLALLAKLM